jgi:hypothetical protein
MRFFGVEIRRSEWTVGILVLVFFLYYSSYYVVREGHTTWDERDGCPEEGCERVDLPMAVYYIYNPLVRADQSMEPQTEFNFH